MKRTLSFVLALYFVSSFFIFTLTSCQSLPDGVIVDNEQYVIERKDGKCHLNFKDGNGEQYPRESGCEYYVPELYFSSCADAQNAFLQGNFTEAQLFDIRHYFERYEDGSIIVPDPENFMIPILPDDLIFDSTVVDSDMIRYSVHSDGVERELDGSMTKLDKTEFEGILQDFESFQNKENFIRTELDSPYPIIVLDNTLNSENLERHVYYTLTQGDKTVHLRVFFYRKNTSVSLADWRSCGIHSVSILVQEKDAYASFYLKANRDDFCPSDDWYLSFGMTSASN